jgi:hypothetical protein
MTIRVLGVALLLGLLAPTPAPADDAPRAGTLREYAKKNQGRFAYGLYIAGKKVGWMIDEMKLTTFEGKEVATERHEMLVAFNNEGEKSKLEEKSDTHYSLEGDGPIVFAETRTTNDKQTTVRVAVRKGEKMVVTTEAAGHKENRTVPVPKDTLGLARRLDEWLNGPRKAGDKFDNFSASWDEEEVDSPETVIFKEKKKIAWGGVPTEVFAVTMEVHGSKSDAELAPDGRLLTGKMGALMEIRAEPENLAKKLDEGGFDLMTASSIPVDKNIGSGRTVEKLTLEATGLDDFTLPESHRQKLVRRDGKLLLELSRDHRVEKASPLTAEEKARYTRATPSLQSDNPKIRELAKSIVGDENEPVEAARRLEEWVYKNLRKTYAENADNALAVLTAKAGDCTEHTLLFTALARAAGLPAREVGGIVYVAADKPVFGWHAWSEVHDGHQWVSVDPTWNEVYVDATHIKFSTGSQDLAWVNVLGKLKLKVVDFEKKKK